MVDFSLSLLFFVLGATILGLVIGYIARQNIAKRKIGTIEAKLEKMMADAKEEAKKMLGEAREKAERVLDEAKREEKEYKVQLSKSEERLARREESIDKRQAQTNKEATLLQDKIKKIQEIKVEVENLKTRTEKELENIAGLSRDDAKNMLLEKVESQIKDDVLVRMHKMEKYGKEELEKKAREIMILSMQRYSSSQASEVSTTSVPLPNDEIKGKIIGKEGRNIRTLERLTGVEIIVDDTPEAITISCFDPVRRQIAKVALEKLISDGRIQPARIEETVRDAEEAIKAKIQEAGEAATYEAGIVGLDPKLIHIIGRLAFRTSYGQNVLLHSLEMVHIGAMLAEELGADVALVKKACLLHDVGKAVDHQIQGSHVEIGRRILQKFGMDEKIVEAMQAHHEEYPYNSIESRIVQTADALSASRPGARRGTLEHYLKRLEELEKIANSFEGVEKSYAIQAGREIRVFVTPEKIDDLTGKKMARDIADRIEQEIKFPGEIKVTVIREMRAIEYAK
jgi:ribonuclease Y